MVINYFLHFFLATFCMYFWLFFVPLQTLRVSRNGKLFAERILKSCPKRNTFT